MNPGMFLLRWYRHVLLCFYYVGSGTYCGGSEFKYPGTVVKNECSILLEICTTPNPTLNLSDSVDKCKTDIKTHLLMQPCYLNLYADFVDRSYMGLESVLLWSQVHLRTPWATEQTYCLWNPINMMLDMCNANIQKHTFSNLPAY